MTELCRLLALDKVGPRPFAIEVESDAAERAAVAARLMLPAVHQLRCRFVLRRTEGGVVLAEGTLRATVEQICVVTLEPFKQDVQDSFAVQFVPSGSEDGEPEPDSVDQIPYEGSAIDLGEAAVEQLALALDPYPRSPGAELPDSVAAAPGPFQALAALRSRT